MTDIQADFSGRLRLCRWGVMLALLTTLFGFGLGGVFGAFESSIKNDLKQRAEAVRDTVYGSDEAKIKYIVDRGWTYYKRAHMHGGGIGAVALGAILLLAALRRPPRLVLRGASLALGLGGLGYGVYWLLAARAAPGLGSTDAAKESLAWLAMPTAGMLLIGMLALLVFAGLELFGPRRTAEPVPAA